MRWPPLHHDGECRRDLRGALAINKDTWNKLPSEVQRILKEVGKDYSKHLGALLVTRYQEALRQMVKIGAKQSVPVQVIDLPAAEREKWVRGMPNLAVDWVKTNKAKGLPVLAFYIDRLRARGVKPVRDWDKGF